MTMDKFDLMRRILSLYPEADDDLAHFDLALKEVSLMEGEGDLPMALLKGAECCIIAAKKSANLMQEAAERTGFPIPLLLIAAVAIHGADRDNQRGIASELLIKHGWLEEDLPKLARKVQKTVDKLAAFISMHACQLRLKDGNIQEFDGVEATHSDGKSWVRFYFEGALIEEFEVTNPNKLKSLKKSVSLFKVKYKRVKLP